MLRLARIRRKVEEMAAKLLLFLNDLLIYNFRPSRLTKNYQTSKIWIKRIGKAKMHSER